MASPRAPPTFIPKGNRPLLAGRTLSPPTQQPRPAGCAFTSAQMPLWTPYSGTTSELSLSFCTAQALRTVLGEPSTTGALSSPRKYRRSTLTRELGRSSTSSPATRVALTTTRRRVRAPFSSRAPATTSAYGCGRPSQRLQGSGCMTLNNRRRLCTSLRMAMLHGRTSGNGLAQSLRRPLLGGCASTCTLRRRLGR